MHFLVILFLSALFGAHASSQPSVQTLSDVPDALSITLVDANSTASVSYRNHNVWSTWEELEIDNEQDPLLRESNLVMFPPTANAVRVKSTGTITLHPIDIAEGPVRYTVAATNDIDTPRILKRSEWGADESLLVREPSSGNNSTNNSTPAATGDNGDVSGATSVRIEECEAAQLNYPDEFKVASKKVTADDYGRTLRWAHSYSPSIKVIAVHHTAVTSAGDSRSGAERVRAIYAYHANGRGWGDVGYHYLIDEEGQIYEGKSGGKYVVAGHAYCNNIGTLGIALMGNFEEEKPTQKQIKSLQWLLKDLTEQYDIDPAKQTTFHGKKTSPIVGHRDLVSTACPGFYIYGSLAQIRNNVVNNDVYASVTLPKKPTVAAKSSKKSSGRTVTTRQSSSAKPSKNATGVLTRATQRLLNTQASQLLRRKLGSNPGKEVEAGVAARIAARQKSASSVRARSKSSVAAIKKSSLRSSKKSLSSKSIIRSSKSSSKSSATAASAIIRIRLTRQETGAKSCDSYNLSDIRQKYRGTVECIDVDGVAALINEVNLEEYMMGLAEEPDTEPYEKQRAFAIAARTYAAYYMDPSHLRKFPGKPYDGSDSPATFQLYTGKIFEEQNPRWLKAVQSTAHLVLTKDDKVIRAPYFSANDGRTRSPAEAGWNNFPFAEIFTSKEDPWCIGETLRGHGVGMSGCGAKGQANEGKTGEEILAYYYPGTELHEIEN